MNHKDKVLGIPFGTASGKLRRSIVFSLLVRCGLNKCHRCSLPMTIENYSIEHIKDWENSDNPIELFYDLDNISFSHKSCNYAASSNKGSINRNKTHCPSGHEYNIENTYFYTKNNRTWGQISKCTHECRKCHGTVVLEEQYPQKIFRKI